MKKKVENAIDIKSLPIGLTPLFYVSGTYFDDFNSAWRAAEDFAQANGVYCPLYFGHLHRDSEEAFAFFVFKVISVANVDWPFNTAPSSLPTAIQTDSEENI